MIKSQSRNRHAPTILALALELALTLGLQGCGSSSGSSGATAATGIQGNFKGTITLQGTDASNCTTGTLLVSLSQVGTALTGTWSSTGFNSYGLCAYLVSNGSVTGTVSGSSVAINALNSSSHGYIVNGTLSGTTITGTYSETLYNTDTNSIVLQQQ